MMKKKTRLLVAILGVPVLIICVFMALSVIIMRNEFRDMDVLETAEIIDGVYAVHGNQANMYLVRTGDYFIAIDAGDNAGHVKTELEKINVHPERIAAVFLTHSDGDHTAALHLFDRALVYISEAEEQMINGKTSRFLLMRNHVDCECRLLKDNAVVTSTDLNIRTILTPGHTPGSMCYLVNDSCLFTGDLLRLKEGKAAVFNAMFNMDSERSRASLRKIRDLRHVKYLFTGHYGYTDDFQHIFE